MWSPLGKCLEGLVLFSLASVLGVLLVGIGGTLCWGVRWLLLRFGHVVLIRIGSCSSTWLLKHSLKPID